MKDEGNLKMNPKNPVSMFVFCLALFAAAATAFAQGTTSRVTGTVHDATGGAVVGATVTLTNDATGIAFTTETSESGAYAFDLVQVGNYSVRVEKQGFKKFLSQGNT